MLRSSGLMSRLELVIEGIPASLQSSARARERWCARVKEAGRRFINEEDEIYGECRGVLVYFYFGETPLDIDNIIKPISDALCQIAYWDDRIISEWVARKTDLASTDLLDPPPILAERLEDWLAREQHFVYVCLNDQGPNHQEMPR